MTETKMAAPVSSKSDCWTAPEVYKHHEQRKICISRPKYREGRKSKAVKVYTINLESRFVMVQGVPAIGVMTELIQLCALYGTVEEYRPLDEYPAEEFTEVYLVKFQKLTSARAAKRRMDEKSFYGGVLHVCYVPEYETVEDTRLKLLDRRKYIMRTVHNIAREKQHIEEVTSEPSTSNSTSSFETITPKPNETVDNLIESSTGHYSGFPLLPLPPWENPCVGYNSQNGSLPTEDKMGTLHNAIVDKRRQPEQSPSSHGTLSNKYRDQEGRHSTQPPAVRFLPRTAQLEKRKRKAEELIEQSLKDVTGQTEAFIGPKLPELPKLDMEDDSLNTTVNLIRGAIKQVNSVPEFKPVEKKVKPRRRI